ncbi:MAG TPA: hypothetical protein VFG68_08170, partial [Fimbriiglobus sp.]|nr:hypothetical protein [Fimbriiglobus sp.]
MSIRLPSALPALLAAAVGLFALTSGLTAQPPAKPAPADTRTVGDLRTPQERNAELFRKFQRELLSLAQKLERSNRPEDKERAKVIYAALDLSRKENVEAQFQKIIAGMVRGTGNLQDLNRILGEDQQLTKALQDILTILLTDDESARIKAEIAKLEAFLKEARAILRQQQTIRAMTDAQKGKPDRLAKNQDDLAGKTKDLGERMGGDKKDGKQGDGRGGKEGIAKSDPKGEAKPGESAG